MKEEKAFDGKRYINILKKKLVLIILFTLLTTGIAAIYSFLIAKPLYKSTATIIIGKDTSSKENTLTQSDVSMYISLIKTYIQIAQSKIVATNAANSLKTEVSPKELMSNMKVSSVLDSLEISIAYQSSNPKDAADSSNALATAFVNQSQVLLPYGIAQFVDRAEENDIPIKPNKTMNIALSFVLGLILSIGLAFLLDFLDNRIKNEEDVDKYLNIPMVGIIAKDTKIGKFTVDKDSNFPITEAFKSIRTNLLFSLKSRDIRTVIVSSSVPNEGKSTISTNIAIAISQIGKTVLIIDCDLRRPSIHRFFELSNSKGLVDVIFDEITLEDAVVKINEHLSVLPSGEIPYNPSELLYTPKMKKFVKDIETKYDYIILDTPPIVAFTDALTLMDQKSGVILVVDSSDTKIDVCKKAIHLLQNINATLIGTVLNKVNKIYIEDYGYSYSKETDKKSNNSRSKRQIKNR